jgi:hypothetical protein
VALHYIGWIASRCSSSVMTEIFVGKLLEFPIAGEVGWRWLIHRIAAARVERRPCHHTFFPKDRRNFVPWMIFPEIRSAGQRRESGASLNGDGFPRGIPYKV